MDSLKKIVKNDKFAKLVGVKLLDVSEGYATAEMTLTDNHLNGLGIAHGGAIFTLADLVFAVASDTTARVLETHITLGHILCDLLERKLYPEQFKKPVYPG